LAAPLTIIAAERHAVAVTEIVLGKIAVKMLHGAVLVNALHAALKMEKLPSTAFV
jgi:hypothetical protein